MLEDKEEGGLLSPLSSSMAAVDCCGRTATSDKDDRQRSAAGPLLASTLQERARNGFRRRVDGPLAKNHTRGKMMGGTGGRTMTVVHRSKIMQDNPPMVMAATRSVGNGKSRGGKAQLGGSSRRR
jgi:hypothetical protein